MDFGGLDASESGRLPPTSLSGQRMALGRRAPLWAYVFLQAWLHAQEAFLARLHHVPLFRHEPTRTARDVTTLDPLGIVDLPALGAKARTEQHQARFNQSKARQILSVINENTEH